MESSAKAYASWTNCQIMAKHSMMRSFADSACHFPSLPLKREVIHLLIQVCSGLDSIFVAALYPISNWLPNLQHCTDCSSLAGRKKCSGIKALRCTRWVHAVCLASDRALDEASSVQSHLVHQVRDTLEVVYTNSACRCRYDLQHRPRSNG
ncbi:hypothetical protein BC830DRAFT_207447 [Chytriomyces sp. MP71]|nr:hypothetical protein BC830DRAFT_207447 [Chytriomyces sp. MP71]